MKEFLALEKRLLPGFPGFAIKGRLMFIQPVGDTLRGFHFEPSAFSKEAFYVGVFFMPLCVPMKHVHFTFGHRVSRKEGWNADQRDLPSVLEREMLGEVPFLVNLKSPRDVVEALRPLAQSANPHALEAFAYTLVRSGEMKAAGDAIDGLLALVDSIKRANPAITWELEIANRAQRLKAKLTVNPEEATAQLVAWESETVHNLGLENFWERIQ